MPTGWYPDAITGLAVLVDRAPPTIQCFAILRFPLHNACMTTSVTVRNVPEDVRNELAAKAARRGQSLQAYLLDTLTEVSTRPDQDELIERIKQRKRAFGTDLKAQAILAARDSDRR